MPTNFRAGGGAPLPFQLASEVVDRNVQGTMDPLRAKIDSLPVADMVRTSIEGVVERAVPVQVREAVEAVGLRQAVDVQLQRAVEGLREELAQLLTVPSPGGPQPIAAVLEELKSSLLQMQPAPPSLCTATNEHLVQCCNIADRAANFHEGPLNRCRHHAQLEVDYGQEDARAEVEWWHSNGKMVYDAVERFIDDWERPVRAGKDAKNAEAKFMEGKFVEAKDVGAKCVEAKDVEAKNTEEVKNIEGVKNTEDAEEDSIHNVD